MSFALDLCNTLKNQFQLLFDVENSSEVEIILRSTISSGEDAEKFVNAYGKANNIKYMSYYGISKPQRIIFSKTWICQHSSRNKGAKSKRNADCKSTIKIVIKKKNADTVKNDRFLAQDPPLVCKIQINPTHSHSTDTALSLALLRVTDESEGNIMENNIPNVKHTGGCHCGAIYFSALAPSKVKTYICNCSVCIKKQIKGFIVPDENFKLLKGKDNLTEYTFNTREAKHWFCKTCGVQSFYKPRSHPNCISVMIFCLEPGTVEEVEEIDFDGQNWEKSIKNLQVHSSK